MSLLKIVQTNHKAASAFGKRAMIINGIYSIGFTLTYIEALWLIFVPKKASSLTATGNAANNYLNSCFLWIGIANFLGTKYKDSHSMKLLLIGDSIGFALWFLFDVYHFNNDFHGYNAFKWPFYFIAAPFTLFCSIHSLIAFLRFPNREEASYQLIDQ